MSSSLRAVTPSSAASAWDDALERLASSSPEWLGAQRRAAWMRARELGLPAATDELWRNSDLALLDPQRFLPSPAAGALPPERAQELFRGAELAGRFEGGGAMPGRSWLSDEARRAGVLLLPLEIAAVEHRALVEERLGRLVGAEDGFLARNLALHRGGAFLYVPRGVELRGPVALVGGLAAPDVARHSRHLIVVEAGARVVLDEVSISEPLAAPGLSHEVVEMLVGEGAWVGWLHWQGLGSGARAAGHRRASLARDAPLESLAVSLGADYSRQWLQVSLDGAGARSDLLGISFPMGEQRLEQWTVQDHVAPQTSSDLLYRSALAGRARSLYHGTIRVHPGARRTDAYQANRNLLLSTGARADTNPQLEIENNDVRCTHGATVGPIDEGQLFYLMTRGLPRPQAERLLVFGFFGDVLSRSAWSAVSEALESALQRRVEGGRA